MWDIKGPLGIGRKAATKHAENLVQLRRKIKYCRKKLDMHLIYRL